MNRLNSDEDIRVLALAKGCERFVFTFYAKDNGEVLRILGSMAANEELSFSWYDAAVLSQKVRE